MCQSKTLRDVHAGQGAVFDGPGATSAPRHFGDAPGEYDALLNGVCIHDRADRGLIEVTGRDRAEWLHNLTTNHVVNVPAGQARYMFVCNVKGRILFDMTALIQPEAIWLDIDRRMLTPALQHLEKYHITEDIALADRSGEFARLALMGRGQHDLLTGADAVPLMEARCVDVASAGVWALRSDFCGLPALDLIAPDDAAPAVWNALVDQDAVPVGTEAVQIHRIEAGLPWSCEDINDDVLPAETGQLQRAVSFDKGCYLGQEVVERMRAHDSLARKLVGLTMSGNEPVPAGASLEFNGQSVGRVTSSCISPRIGGPIALGYVRSALSDPGTELHAAWDRGRADASVVALPFASHT